MKRSGNYKDTNALSNYTRKHSPYLFVSLVQKHLLAPHKQISRTYTLQASAKLFCFLSLWSSITDSSKDAGMLVLPTNRAGGSFLASVQDAERAVNASLEHRKQVTGTKEVLQRAAQEAAKLRSKIWQACLLLFKLTTKETPGREKIWTRSSMHMCCVQSRVRMSFSKCVTYRYAYMSVYSYITTHCRFLEPENSICLGPNIWGFLWYRNC